MKRFSTSDAIGVLIVGGIALAYFVPSIHDKPQTDESAPAVAALSTPALDRAKCRADITCWAENTDTESTAAALCRTAINASALHDVKWTDDFPQPMFDGAVWDDQKKGTVLYSGDHVMLQNGFGAMTAMTYVCKFDPATRTLFSLQMAQGHMSNDVLMQALASSNLLSEPQTMPAESSTL